MGRFGGYGVGEAGQRFADGALFCAIEGLGVGYDALWSSVGIESSGGNMVVGCGSHFAALVVEDVFFVVVLVGTILFLWLRFVLR